MNKETRLLVTDEPVEVQDFGSITNHFGGICGACLRLYNEQPIGSQHIIIIWTWKHEDLDQLCPKSLQTLTSN